jgi:hypothetical protein
MRILSLALALVGTQAFAATYYIDWTAGSDSNNGTSKATPWQRAPGMNGCANICSQTVPKAGDRFIFKGGVSWPAAAFTWQFQWSGTDSVSENGCTQSSCIYIGVDQTWFTGGAWARPIFDGGGSAVGTNNRYLWLTASAIVVDNFEWRGFYAISGAPYCTNDFICMNSGAGHLEIKNNYFHGWTHPPYNSGASNDEGQVMTGDTGAPSGNANSSVHDNVADGTDTTGDSMAFLHGGPDVVFNNYVYNMSNGFVGEYVDVHNNTVLNINESYNPTQHENGLEINFSQNAIVYNNIIAKVYWGLALWVAPEAGYTHYLFNNVMYDITTTNVFDLASALINPSGSVVAYNNTIECGPSTAPNFVCIGGIASSIASVTLENNHFITNATTPNSGIWSTNGPIPALKTNILQNYASACTSQGYCGNQSYPFSPNSGSGATVGLGTNLSSACVGKLAPLCSDTTSGVSYNAATHSVTGPYRVTNPRPSTGPWDVGAYQFSATTTLSSPSLLTATVQ